MKVRKSPNFDDRSGAGIKYLILHYTGMATGTEALERLCDAQAEVSAHYLVEEDGEIYQLVDEDKRAWHAGLSKWEEDDAINDLSIGIEIVNSGHAYPGYESIYRKFPEAQMEAVIKLAQEIIYRHAIKPCYVLGHSDVAWRRKIDPGELFDWTKLSKNGVGCWPKDNSVRADIKVDLEDFMRNLQAYGYDVADCENNPSEIITAFQRHFRQDNIDGQLDIETVQRLGSLLEQKLS